MSRRIHYATNKAQPLARVNAMWFASSDSCSKASRNWLSRSSQQLPLQWRASQRIIWRCTCMAFLEGGRHHHRTVLMCCVNISWAVSGPPGISPASSRYQYAHNRFTTAPAGTTHPVEPDILTARGAYIAFELLPNLKGARRIFAGSGTHLNDNIGGRPRRVIFRVRCGGKCRVTVKNFICHGAFCLLLAMPALIETLRDRERVCKREFKCC